MLGKITKELRIFRILGTFSYLKHFFTKKGETLSVSLFGKNVVIRKNSPDIFVAHSNLGTEFDCVAHLFGEDYSGTIVDAGAYIGTAAIAFSKIYPQAKIICIEPSTENHSLLTKNTAGIENIKVLKKALCGIANGSTVSLRNRGTGEWGYTIIEEPDDASTAGEMENVECISLSELGIAVSDIGILKLDIEGAEKDIFDSSTNDVKAIPAIIVELHDRIVPGCADSYRAFSSDRWTVKDGNEKYLSLFRG